jgi:DNA-binding MarR family transcriptional regulator
LRKASRRISQLYDLALAPSGLKATQHAIVAEIDRSEPTAVGSLAEALVMDPGALAHTLKPLERDGLVRINIDPRDRRSRSITLTAGGRRRLAAADKLWVKAQHAFEEAFGEIESEAVRKAMRHLVAEEFVAAFEARVSTD